MIVPNSVSKPLTVALIGNPNTGKSTLFNALTGIHSHIGNYPGVTVEKKVGRLLHQTREILLVDLPGTYSLSPRSLDEMVSVDVLLGRQPDLGQIDVVVCIVDASNLERNLYLVSQVLDLGLPTVLVLNKWDVAEERGFRINVEDLSDRLNIPVIRSEAHRRRNLNDVKDAILVVETHPTPPCPRVFPIEFYEAAKELQSRLTEWGEENVPFYVAERLLMDVGGQIECSFLKRYPEELPAALMTFRANLQSVGLRVPAAEAKYRYAWARKVLEGAMTIPTVRSVTRGDRLDRILTHQIWGMIVFCLVMFVVFQSISALAEPLMTLCERAQQAIGAQVGSLLPYGPFRSLLVDGVIAGVGGILVFLPQICFLFFFIALLEDCGYMPRAAFLMDKLMVMVGLSGKSFVPLMASFACAIPGIMATRTIESRRDRMVTILVAPLMSCSARAPVYSLMIAAFFPRLHWAGGWISLHGTMMFVMTFFGAVVAIPVAWVFKKTLFQGETSPFVMELPSYKWPSARIVACRVYDRAQAFVFRAGTLIFATSILIWAACYFPGDHTAERHVCQQIEQIEYQIDIDPGLRTERDVLIGRRNELSAALLEASFLGRFGKGLEPMVRPLGWDWRIGVSVLASFPAREVIVATLGTIYGLGGDVDETRSGLQQALRDSIRADGRPVYSIPVALSIMFFFALCAQCSSTLMVIRRETNSWGWSLFTFSYMTTLAYFSAWAVYQLSVWWIAEKV